MIVKSAIRGRHGDKSLYSNDNDIFPRPFPLLLPVTPLPPPSGTSGAGTCRVRPEARVRAGRRAGRPGLPRGTARHAALHTHAAAGDAGLGMEGLFGNPSFNFLRVLELSIPTGKNRFWGKSC